MGLCNQRITTGNVVKMNEKTISQPSPLDTINNLTAAINRGDLEAMLKLFEEDAVLVVQALAGQPRQIARGKVAIREAYAGFDSLKPTLNRQVQEVIRGWRNCPSLF